MPETQTFGLAERIPLGARVRVKKPRPGVLAQWVVGWVGTYLGYPHYGATWAVVELDEEHVNMYGDDDARTWTTERPISRTGKRFLAVYPGDLELLPDADDNAPLALE